MRSRTTRMGSKTIKIILIFVVIAGVIGAGVYFGTKTSNPTGATPEGSLPSGQAGEQTGLPSAATGTEAGQGATPSTETGSIEEDIAVLGLKIVYKEPVLGFAPLADGRVILIDQKGTIASVSPSGEVSELNNSGLESPLEAVFSTDGKKILLTYGNITAPQFSVYDVASSTWQPILSNTVATLRPKTHEVVYLYDKLGVKNLFVWNLDKPKTTPQQISSLQIEDPVLSWRDKDTLIIQSRPSAYIKDSIIAFNLTKKTASPIIVDKYALSAIWNDTQTLGLAFYGNNTFRGGNLRLYSPEGVESSKLALLTLPEKCSFLHSAGYFSTTTLVSTSTSATAPKNELFCAFPRDSKTFSAAVLPDEYYRGAITVSDDLIKINLDDGSLGYLYSPKTAQMDMYKTFAGESLVYFIDKNTGILYSVPNK